MLALSWTFFAVLAVFWTGAAWITATATEWLAQALASGSAAQAARDVAALPLPAWMEPWLDPSWLKPLQAALLWLVDSAGGVLPLAGTAAGWLVPAVWTSWGLGMVLLLLGGGVAHVLVRRFAGHGTRRAPLAKAA